MGDIIVSLIVVIVTALFVIALFVYLNSHNKKEQENLQQLASQKGWRLDWIKERLVSGHRIHGVSDGVAWIYESLAISQDAPAAPGSAETRRCVRWFSSDIGLSSGVAAIGPGIPGNAGIPDMGGFQGMLIQKALKLLLGDEADLMTGLRPVPYGSAAFQQHYMAWAQRPEDIERLMSGISENELLYFQGDKRLLIKLTRTGLDISVSQGVKLRLPEVERLINLGSKLARFWKA